MATVNFFDAFQYEWAETGDTFAWDDAQYRLGWATVGSTPPSVEQFNRVHQVADEKANWLYGQLATVAAAKSVTLSAGSLTGLQQVLAAYTPAATELVSGILRLASVAQAQALVDDATALTPKKLADAFKGANQSLLTNGYQKLPGGLILQWCTVTGSLGGTALVTFPITFPNVALHAMSFYIAGVDPGTSGPASIGGTLYGTLATNAVNVRFAPGYLQCRVLAWGY